jgi:hypothetical protein
MRVLQCSNAIKPTLRIQRESTQSMRTTRLTRAGRLFAAGPPQGKKAPLGGSKPALAGVAWGQFLAAGPPQGKKAPSGGSKPALAGAAWGPIYFFGIGNAIYE